MRARGRRRWATVLGGEKSAKGMTGEGLRWRPVESDEERAARAGTRERKRERHTEGERGEKRKTLCDARGMRGGDVGEDRKRKRETETDSVLDPPGIDAFVCQNAETPASFLPSFLPSLFSALRFRRPPILLVRRFPSFSLCLASFLSVSLSLCPSFPVPVCLTLSLFPSRSLLLTSFVLRAFTSCC